MQRMLSLTLQLTTEKTEVSDAMFGGNASAEGGAEEAAEDVSQSGCNIVLANRLQETGYSKKEFQIFIKVVFVHSLVLKSKSKYGNDPTMYWEGVGTV